MHSKASEFLKPIHVFGKLCGVFPVDSLCNDSVSRTYYIFCVALLVSNLHPLYAMFMYQYVRYSDIVCFTVTLHVICILFSNVVNIFVPIQCRRTYVKLFKKLDYVHDLVYKLNIKQTESPSKVVQCVSIFLTLLVQTCFCSLIYFDTVPKVAVFGVMLYYLTFNAFILQLTSILVVVRNKYLLIKWHLDYLNNNFPPFLPPPEGRYFVENKIYANNVEDKFVNTTYS